MKPEVAARECLRVLKTLIGPAAVPSFLAVPQPALEDRTGRQLLDSDPVRLLKRLRGLQKETEAAP